MREAGLEVRGLVAIFTYGFELAHSNFAEAECPYITLTDYDIMLNKALANNLISEEELTSLREWKVNPQEWKK